MSFLAHAAARAAFVALLLVPFAHAARADTFGSGENAFSIPMVTVGDPGNAPDTTGAPNPVGAVGYTYRIGKYEVPEEAVRKANALSELAGEQLGITLDERGPQKPATGLSWFEAARFVNWLNEDAGFHAAYKFDDGPLGTGEFQLWEPTDPGFIPGNRFRNSLARYVLPSADEWYKAAFYDPFAEVYYDYPTGSDMPPTPVMSGTDLGTAVWNQDTGPTDVVLAGGSSPYGTIGQGGNVSEWHEGPASAVPDIKSSSNLRAIRGSDWGLAVSAGGMSSLSSPADLSPKLSFSVVGFRVLTVPEPSGFGIMLAIVLLGAFIPRFASRQEHVS
ncbi:Formylglycine-generating sulfatase enzyme [Pseudobythopirellula maris]|uniref:Formylglycine-generating sulfatase enzyme n=1 Tax=Pseudobythopirellula maris TaxID=2527991 RepID=A0A5C5ZQY1_9BACT|nr:SUMF1/EgtB/PvdO family nonheme iron enzyme [Pseudobythopirellula maris]TWT88713.1 Formylglycine-generating sulfatase enzyme [Pseudobythopirellula maris]